MDDVKLFGKNKKQLDSLVKRVTCSVLTLKWNSDLRSAVY